MDPVQQNMSTSVYFALDVNEPKGKHNKRRSRRQGILLEAVSMSPLPASFKRVALILHVWNPIQTFLGGL